ncbi:MAG: zeta toxin family protein [Blastocatellia bacterium]|nr:zeta toxin family protein [Blastocatellia bacterium]
MSDSAPQIIVIAGPNGAGKSTLAPSLLRDRFGLMQYVNADTIALGLSAFDPERVAFEAGRIMLKRLKDLSGRRASFAFESILASRSHARWIRRLRQQGYEFHLLFLWLQSPEIAIQRVRERVRLGGHDVPDEVIRRRYKLGMRYFFDFYQSLVKTWVVYDNSISSGPLLIADGEEKTVPTVYQPDLWSKISEAAKWE